MKEDRSITDIEKVIQKLESNFRMGEAGLGQILKITTESINQLSRKLEILNKSVRKLHSSVSQLHQNLEKWQRTNSRFTKAMIALTIVIAILTAIMAWPIFTKLLNFMAQLFN